MPANGRWDLIRRLKFKYVDGVEYDGRYESNAVYYLSDSKIRFIIKFA